VLLYDVLILYVLFVKLTLSACDFICCWCRWLRWSLTAERG